MFVQLTEDSKCSRHASHWVISIACITDTHSTVFYCNTAQHNKVHVCMFIERQIEIEREHVVVVLSPEQMQCSSDFYSAVP